ncbi:MAG TPA: DUF4191 domain-containing protein [Actinomycetales bacterium]|uniref:DUF4191 domain-containing protein n=1 Tax=uncultured Corynebacterium sp. TaxID=159447 RepID=UPI001770A51B|nr:DUF4191 domain-containing protein [uncultured Corynebacterium sp.]HHU45671.1 DUF4191 domain-containing protein [Actinomycetales bacterium]
MANKDELKAAKKAERAAKRAKGKQTRSQMWQAFKLQKGRDKKLIPYMALGFFGPVLLLLVIGLLIGGFSAWIMPILGVLIGVMVAMWIFSQRLQNSFYDEAEGQAGAASWALENMRSGVGTVWHVTTAAQANQQLDAVHRVIGNPGVVLVGEGNEGRVRQMMSREKKALARFLGETPIYEIMAGSGEGQVPVKKLQREMLRFPRNYNKDEANKLASRVESMERIRDARSQLPKGPLPKGGMNQAGMNRRARRAQERQQRRG